MANNNTHQFQSTMERGTTKLYLKATFASGVATVVRGRGIKQFVKEETGKYAIEFGTSAPARVAKYAALLGVQATFLSATGLPAAPLCAVIDDDAAGDGVIVVGFSDAETPALTDPADGDTLLLEITLANTDAY